jgi:hypothetical protein
MDNSFLKEQADRCRCLAENADQFTKRRLLDLAESTTAGWAIPRAFRAFSGNLVVSPKPDGKAGRSNDRAPLASINGLSLSIQMRKSPLGQAVRR